jgi:hypothetical protein
MGVNQKSTIRRSLLIAAALSITALVSTPAIAGGRYDHGYYGDYGRDYNYRRYDGRRHHGYYDYRHKRRGHISGGEAALIAAGVIGGVILIDRALDNQDRRDDERNDRRYDDRYDGRSGAFNDGYYYERDDRDYGDRSSGRAYDRGFEEGYSSAREDRNIDDILLGDDEGDARRRDSAARPRFADLAFRECVAETRGAAGQGGLRVAMPGAPERVEQLADGSVRMSASFRASNARGEQWTRRFVCEADEAGVRLLQVD